MKQIKRWIFLTILTLDICSALDLKRVGKYQFDPADPAYQITLPRDLGSHPKKAYEWWYTVGHLFADANFSKKQGSFQAVVFRISRPLPSRQTLTFKVPPSLYVVNLVFTDLTKEEHHHTSYHVVPMQAPHSLTQDEFTLDLSGVQLRINKDGSMGLSYQAVFPKGGFISLQADLSSSKPLVLQGEKGYSKKGVCSTCGSHYLTYSRLNGRVLLEREGQEKTYYGLAWHDHEFGSQTLSPEQIGWNWFGIQLDSGEEIMLFLMRRSEQDQPAFRSGSWIDKSGEVKSIPGVEIEMTPLVHTETPSGVVYPTTWRLKLGGQIGCTSL